MLLGIIIISGCTIIPSRGTEIVINPSDLTLEELMITQSDIGSYQFVDLSVINLTNPFIMRGSNITYALALLEGFTDHINKSKVNGVLITALVGTQPSGAAMGTQVNGPTGTQTSTINFGFYAIEYNPNQLTMNDVDGVISGINALVRQQESRFRLFVATNVIIILWANSADQLNDINFLRTLMINKYGLTESSFSYIPEQEGLVNHINTDVNINVNTTGLTTCNNDSNCNVNEGYYCLKCPQMKLMYTRGCVLAPGVTRLNETHGLCIQSRKEDGYMYGMILRSAFNSFYSGECMTSGGSFCLVNFSNQEIPTQSPNETNRLLPLWKAKLINQLGLNKSLGDSYWSNHVYIHSVEFNSSFIVRYRLIIDWVNILYDTQTLTTGVNGTALSDEEIINNTIIPLNHPIYDIIPESRVQSILDTCISSLIQSEPYLVNGSLLIRGEGIRQAVVNLETGELISCGQ